MTVNRITLYPGLVLGTDDNKLCYEILDVEDHTNMVTLKILCSSDPHEVNKIYKDGYEKMYRRLNEHKDQIKTAPTLKNIRKNIK